MTDTTIDSLQTLSAPPEKTPSYRSVLAHAPVRIVAASRFLSRMAGQTLSYGIMVFLAAAGASQFEISLANSAAYLAALLFGLQGGLLADSRPKRQILLVGFALLGAVCFLTPFLLGTSGGDLLFVIFVSSAISQVVTPGFKSIVAIVSSPEEVATAGAAINIVGSIGSSIGSAFIAPVLIKQTGIEVLLIVAGVLFLLSAIRIYRLPTAEALGKHELTRNLRELDWKPRALSLRYNANWIMANRPVASMLLVAALSASLLHGVTALLPVFVRDVLDQDPANAVYIFFLSGIGFFVGAFASPSLLRRFGERRVAVGSIVVMAISVALFGVIGAIAGPLALISPLRLANYFFDANLSNTVLAAGVLVFPANLGSTICLQAVQVYVNKHIDPAEQGGIFGLQQVQENAFNLAVILLLGAIATVTGPQYVFLFAPIVVAILGLVLISYSYRHTTGTLPHLSASIGFFIEGSDADIDGAALQHIVEPGSTTSNDTDPHEG